jgi:hypothetical protein
MVKAYKRDRVTDRQRDRDRQRKRKQMQIMLFFNIPGQPSFEIVKVSEHFLDLGEVPFLYFSQENFLFRKNMIKFYLLDPPDLVFVFEKNITSLSALVSR